MKKILCIWIPIIIVAPFIFILLISYFLQKTTYTEVKYAILIFDFSKEITLAEYLGIYASILGAEVTVLLSYMIFKLGDNKEKSEMNEKTEISKRYLYSLGSFYWIRIGEYISERYIKNGLDMSKIKLEKKLFDINEMWMEKILFIKSEISETDYLFLFNYFMDIKCLLLDQDLNKFLKKYTIPFWLEGLPIKEMRELDNFEVMQSFKLYSSLKRLIGEEATKRICDYGNGHRFYVEDERGDKYFVNSADGEKIYDFNFNSKTGFATNFIEDEIGSQGEFINGRQVSGISYNALCDENGNYMRDWNGGNYQIIEKENFIENNTLFRRQADFDIIDGKYVRRSEIRYVERII